MKALKGVDVYLYIFFNLGARWGEWLMPHPCRFSTGNNPVSNSYVHAVLKQHRADLTN